MVREKFEVSIQHEFAHFHTHGRMLRTATRDHAGIVEHVDRSAVQERIITTLWVDGSMRMGLRSSMSIMDGMAVWALPVIRFGQETLRNC